MTARKGNILPLKAIQDHAKSQKHSLLNCDVATHDEKMMLANLKFLTKFLMSNASIKGYLNLKYVFWSFRSKGKVKGAD